MPETNDAAFSRTTRNGLWLVLALGVAWRLARYGLRMPLWGDEAALALNLLDGNFAALLDPLPNGQVSPVLFLWLEKVALLAMGTSELALRLLPLAAGLAGLWLFYKLSRIVIEALPAALATGILAVSYYAVRHSVEVKPYSFDLLAAVALLLPAALFIRERNARALVAWALVAPVAVLVSYPAVFVFGASALALLTRLRGALNKERLAWLAGCALGAGAFAWMLVAVASRQYNAPQSLMTVNYWKESFPPAALWKAPLWLADIHAGNMMAYPVGGRHWGSIGTLLLCGIGAAVSAKKWPRPLLVLFATPFVLTLIAAAMHRYPYGGSARIAQHLAPAICLWAGLGAAWLLERQRDENKRRLAVAAVFSLLAIVGVVGIARDFLHPAKTPGDARARERVREWTAAPGGCVLAVWEPMETVPVNFQWYLRQGGSAIVWNARADESWAAARGPVSVLNFDPNAQLAKRLPAKLPGFRVTDSSREEILVGPPELGPAHWESVRLEPPQPAKLKVP